MLKDLIARILGIETYLDVAIELIKENARLNDAVFIAYEKGKEAAYKEISENTEVEEIEIDDLLELTGEENEAN